MTVLVTGNERKGGYPHKAVPFARSCGRSGLGTPSTEVPWTVSCSRMTALILRAEGLREALTSTGNGYLCARGAAEWEDADGVHYPGTYVHGGYNRETTILGGLPVLNEDLVNMPNWLVLQLRIEGGDVIRLADVELLGYRHELDMRFATVNRHLSFRDHEGRETTLHSRRFVSMADAHHGGIEWTLVPENWSGRVEVVTAIDGGSATPGSPATSSWKAAT